MFTVLRVNLIEFNNLKEMGTLMYLLVVTKINIAM